MTRAAKCTIELKRQNQDEVRESTHAKKKKHSWDNVPHLKFANRVMDAVNEEVSQVVNPQTWQGPW